MDRYKPGKWGVWAQITGSDCLGYFDTREEAEQARQWGWGVEGVLHNPDVYRLVPPDPRTGDQRERDWKHEVLVLKRNWCATVGCCRTHLNGCNKRCNECVNVDQTQE